MADITWTTERRKLSDLIPWPRNPRQITKDQARRLSESLDEFGQVQTIAISPDNQILDGHQRQLVWAASEKWGPDLEVDVRVASRALTEKEREKLAVYLHKGAAGEWNFDVLANEFELDELLEWGFTEYDFQLAGVDWGEDEADESTTQEEAQQTLAERFIVPPFSVLDARQGYWQERKRAWLALGIQSELGRGGAAEIDDEQNSAAAETVSGSSPEASAGGVEPMPTASAKT